MKTKKYLCLFYLLTLLCNFNSYAYEIVQEIIRVTPGCEGGVLYSKIESGKISSMPKNSNVNAENKRPVESNSEAKREDLIEEKESDKQFLTVIDVRNN